MEVLINIPEEAYKTCLKLKGELDEDNSILGICLINSVANGTLLSKGHGDLIDRSKLKVCSIDITDLPTDKGLMVYYAEDVDKAPAIIKADNESEAADL